MAYLVLVMGLPKSGKTTLAKKLCRELQARLVVPDTCGCMSEVVVPSRRTCTIGDNAIDICDFAASLEKQREILNPNFVIWMDTVDHPMYWINPTREADVVLKNWRYDIESIAADILRNYRLHNE